MTFPVAIGAGVIGYLIGRSLDGKDIQVALVAPQDGRPIDESFARFVRDTPDATRPIIIQQPTLEPFAEMLTEGRGLSCRIASVTYPLARMLDARWATRVLFVVSGPANDQNLTLQVVGHVRNEPGDLNGLFNIGGTITLGTSGVRRLSIGIDLSTDWQPYLGLTVASGGTPPTAGVVHVEAHGLRWRLPAPLGQV